MNKAFTLLLVTLSGFSFASANTYNFDVSNDVTHPSNQTESIYGYDVFFDVLVPNPLPASSNYTFSIQNKSLTTASIQNVNGFRATGSDGLGNTVTSYNTDGNVSALFPAPSSGTVNFTISGVLTGATCGAWGGDCIIPPYSANLSIPVSSASVNLNISVSDLFENFLHLVGIAEAGQ